MTKQEYLKELKRAFKDFVFFENDHHYEYKGKRVGISVTRLIEQYANEFNAELIAQKIAIRDNKSVQEVLDEWKLKNELACEKGSLGHIHVQNLFEGNILEEEKSCSTCLKSTLELIFKQGENFYNDFKDKLKLIANEFIIGSSEYDIASAIDGLFVNKATGGLVLVDYKTNSDIHKNERYAKPMKAPLGNLKDNTLNHYYLQLSLYKYIVEKYTNLQVEEMFIVYMSENNSNYEIINVPYLEKEAQEILEWRIYE